MKRERYLDEWKGEKNQAARSPCTALNETYLPPPPHPSKRCPGSIQHPSPAECWTTPLRFYLLDCAARSPSCKPEDAIARQIQQCPIHRIMGWRNPVLPNARRVRTTRNTSLSTVVVVIQLREEQLNRKKRVWFSVIFFYFFFRVRGGWFHHAVVWKKFMRHGGRTVWSSRCAVETNSGSSSPPRRKQSPEMGWCEFIVYCFCL